MKSGDLLIERIELEFRLKALKEAVERKQKLFRLLIWTIKEGDNVY